MRRRDAFHSLRLDGLSLQVHLGCTQEERRAPQEVRLSVEFRFEIPPAGAVSDRLEDTVCYAEVSSALKAELETGEFNLIEKLGCDAYRIVKSIAGENVSVAMSAHKVRPPVVGLEGGTTYRCADFPP